MCPRGRDEFYGGRFRLNNFDSGLSVSPDGQLIIYSLVGNVNSDIMLVDSLSIAVPHSLRGTWIPASTLIA